MCKRRGTQNKFVAKVLKPTNCEICIINYIQTQRVFSIRTEGRGWNGPYVSSRLLLQVLSGNHTAAFRTGPCIIAMKVAQ